MKYKHGMGMPVPYEDMDPLEWDRENGDVYRGPIRQQRLKGFVADNAREMIKNLEKQEEAPAEK